ncbi:hypothetical protein RJZ57_003754 [Blastomyces gilchristii]
MSSLSDSEADDDNTAVSVETETCDQSESSVYSFNKDMNLSASVTAGREKFCCIFSLRLESSVEIIKTIVIQTVSAQSQENTSTSVCDTDDQHIQRTCSHQ